MKKSLTLVLVLVLVAVSGCATKQQTGTMAGTAIGAAVGAGLGQAIGHDTKATVIGALAGAALGGIAGNQIGAYMDRQQQALQNAMAQSEAVNVARTQNVLTATFKSDYLFDYNSSALKPGAYQEIDRVARVLNDYPQTTIRIEGHTDTKGSEEYNLKLSERRAQAVKDALVQKGVDAARMQAMGFGESMPISSEDALNRRVNVVITPVQAQ